MKSEEIKQLFGRFEAAAINIGEVGCWSARGLQGLLGYSKWENFEKVIQKAKEACKNAGSKTEDHFPDVGKVIEAGKGARQIIEDIALTRYACYLIAQNGDSRKSEIAFAQNYFAVQTRRSEIIEQRILDHERVQAREKLTLTEKNLSGILYEKGIDNQGFAIIRSKGDQALFNISTPQLKKKLGIPDSRPLADFLPTISIKAKDLAAEMTSINVQSKDLTGQNPVEKEHVENSSAVRKMLLERSIQPENLPKAEDVKKVKRKLQGSGNSFLKTSKSQKNKKGEQ